MDSLLAWLKKWWQLLTAGLFILSGILYEILMKRSTPTLPNSSASQREAERKAVLEDLRAQEVHRVAREAARLERERAIQEQREEIARKTSLVVDDVDATNQALLDVGKSIRSKS